MPNRTTLPSRHLLALTAVLIVPSLSAQLPAPATNQLRAIFASREYANERFGPARWIEQGAAYPTVERAATGGAPTSSGTRLPPGPGPSSSRPADDSGWAGSRSTSRTTLVRRWSADSCSSPTRSESGARTPAVTTGSSTGRRTLKQLGGPEHRPRASCTPSSRPDGDRVGYVRHGEIYVERLADGAITRLTSGADSLHVNGMTDWVYEEEFNLRDAFRWSPDGARIAYWHFDMTGVGTFKLINTTDSIYPIVTPIQYPKVGTPNSAVTVGVVSAAGGADHLDRRPGRSRARTTSPGWNGPDRPRW